MTERYAEVKRIFLEVRSAPPAERAAVLEHLCRGKDDLQAEVAEMLEVDEAEPGFLAGAAPTPDSVLPAFGSHAPGSLARVAKLVRQSNTDLRYERGEQIGVGGMGVVHEALDTDLRRVVAIKVVRGEYRAGPDGETPGIDTGQLARFIEEAQVTAQLEHPGIIPIHEIGVDSSGHVYFTMRRVRGQELSEIFSGHRLLGSEWTQARVVGLLQRVCETVSFAHSKGIVHRDLKPANVMVGDFGEVYVMDWGLALFRDTDSVLDQPFLDPVSTDRQDSFAPESDGLAQHTLDGTILGSPHTMSPEQASGRSELVDERTDIYALGSMLYHLLGGKQPYARAGESERAHEIVKRVAKGPPDPIRASAPNAPDELVAIAGKAMARRPEDRYSSMRELGQDLSAYLEGRVVQAHRTGVWIQVRKWTSRNPLLAAALLASVLAIVGGLRVSISKTQLAERRLRETVRQSYRSSINAAARELSFGLVERARSLLEATPLEERNWEWRFLHNQLSPDVAYSDYLGHGAPILFPGVLPDGRPCGVDLVGGVRLWNRRDRTSTLHRFEGGPPESMRRTTIFVDFEDGLALSVCLLPEERLIPVLWELATGLELRRYPPLPGHFVQGGSLAAGSQAPFLYGQNRPFGLRTDGSHSWWELELPNRGNVHFSISGSSLLVALTTQLISLDLATGEQDKTPISTHGLGDSLLAFNQAISASTDGRRVALASSLAEDVVVLDPSTGLVEITLSPGETPARELVFDRSGNQLAALTENELRIWRAPSWELVGAYPLDGPSEDTAPQLPKGASSWSGEEFVTPLAVDGQYGMRVWLPGEIPSRLGAHDSYVYSVAHDPLGLRIASADFEGQIRLWDPDSAQQVATIEARGRGRGLAFEPGGRWFASTSLFGVQFWESENGTALGELEMERGAECIAMHPSGQSFAVGSSLGRVQLFSAKGRSVVAEAPTFGTSIRRLTFSPDGSRLYAITNCPQFTQGGVSLTIFDGETLTVEETKDFGRLMLSLAVSPNGEQLACGQGDGTITLLSSADLSLEQHLTGHVGEVFSLRYLSPERLVSAGRDGTIRIWDPETGIQLHSIHEHRDYVHDLAVSPDGTYIVSGSGDREVRVWRAHDSSSRPPPLRTGPTESGIGTEPKPPLEPSLSPGSNGVLLLDGSSALVVPDPGAFLGLEAFTIECWVRGRAPSGRSVLISNTDSSGCGIRWNDPPHFPGPHGVLSVGWEYSKTAPVSWDWSRWTHVALCFDGQQLTFFIDGAPGEPTPIVGRPTSLLLPVVIGGDPNDFGKGVPSFSGAVDEVRISNISRYQEAFEPSERHAPDDATLLLLHFDALLGRLHVDSSSGVRHAEPIGTPRLVPEDRDL